MSVIKNVLGENLQPCSTDPMTGYHRDGYCQCGSEDQGQHIVCIKVTDEFLDYSKKAGNDLSTPFPIYGFPGLNAGDQWCLCMVRWIQALEANAAPQVVLESTHERILAFVDLDILKAHAYQKEEASS